MRSSSPQLSPSAHKPSRNERNERNERRERREKGNQRKESQRKEKKGGVASVSSPGRVRERKSATRPKPTVKLGGKPSRLALPSPGDEHRASRSKRPPANPSTPSSPTTQEASIGRKRVSQPSLALATAIDDFFSGSRQSLVHALNGKGTVATAGTFNSKGELLGRARSSNTNAADNEETRLAKTVQKLAVALHLRHSLFGGKHSAVAASFKPCPDRADDGIATVKGLETAIGALGKGMSVKQRMSRRETSLVVAAAAEANGASVSPLPEHPPALPPALATDRAERFNARPPLAAPVHA